VRPRSLVARNTATESTNRIHSDEVAQQYGFRGGLVPGVDVYAYLAHPPAAAWGRTWLDHGWMRARFVQPVYDGEAIDVVPVGEQGLEVRNGAGSVCATAEAGVSDAGRELVDPARWPDVAPVEDPPPAAPEVLVPGTPLGLAPHRFHVDRSAEYLEAVGETLPVYLAEGLAHPGWVLRDANYVLSANVRLGPWIHVSSDVQHLRAVRDGELVAARAIVVGEWEHKGHRFVRMDVLHLADGEPVARTDHTAIYRPRPKISGDPVDPAAGRSSTS
jgi:acyl-coenzyme A thioesterase PaaI-like protein